MRILPDFALLPVLIALLTLSACGSDGAANGGSDPAEPASSTQPEGPVETSTWEAGGTIASGREGVKPIEILEVRKNGAGPVCGEGKRATLRYKAMKASGEVLDPGRRPFSFTVGQRGAIEGWQVIVAKMRVGDEFTVLIPQELCYGPSQGDLKFDMELLSVQ